MFRTFGLFCVFATAIALQPMVATADDVSTLKVKLKQGDRLVFFGDSLTAQALGPTGYVTLVRSAIADKYKGMGIEVDAVATGGHTVPDLLKRLDKDVLSKKPTIVVIQIGCNDARRIAKDVFKSGLLELHERLGKAGVQVVQCSLTTVGEKHDGSNKSDPQLEEFAQVEREVAQANRIPLNDLRKAFMDHLKQHNPQNKPSGILTNDGNHFNDVGQKFVAEQMLSKFE
jgi:lysophospholipase L1-like esterase